MRRTNIYLEDAQSEALEEASRLEGISRAELVRRLIDQGMSEGSSSDIDVDLAAIEDSFGVLLGADGVAEGHGLERGVDDRARHLDRINRS
jgi:hypothetical protein